MSERAGLKAARAARPFRLSSSCTVTAAGGDGSKLGTFEGNAYTGAPMRPGGWYQDIVIDLDGVTVPKQHRPVLRQHDHEQVVGHTTSVKVDKEGVLIAGVFSGQPEHVEKVTVPARNGFQWELSVGADPVRTEFLEAGEETEVNGRQVVGPLMISRETRLGEVSFVPLGADGDTSVSVAAQKGKSMNKWALALKALMAEVEAGKARLAAGMKKYTDAEIDNMSADEARSAFKKCMKHARAEDEEDDDEEDDDDAEGEDEYDDGQETKGGDDDEEEKKSESRRARHGIRAGVKGYRAQIAAETARIRRITEITAANPGLTGEVKAAGGKKQTVVIREHAIAEGWSAERTELAYALAELRAQRPGPGVGVPGGLAYSTTAPAVNGAVLEAAVLHALRHQLQLEDDSFYTETAPDGRTQLRRVPQRIQAEVQRDFRARYTDQVQQAAHTHFRGRATLHQVLEQGVRAMGYTGAVELRSEGGLLNFLKAWDYLDRQGVIRAEGASNVSISNVLANVMNKFALQGYLFTEQTWREFCAIRPVSDFKATKSINLLGQTMFRKFGAAGELANFTLGDQAFSNQADPYGGILTIPWTHLVNDDLGILGQVPSKVGQGAGLALNDAIYTLLAAMAAGSVNGDDGVAFFRTGSLLTDAAKKNGKAYKANKMSGGTTALSSAALQTARALYDNQIDPNGNPLGFDGAMPVLLFGPSNWVTATELLSYREIVYGGATAAKQPQGNVWAGTMRPAMSRYVENAAYVNSATAFFLFYNPAALAVIEACFLNGVDTPSVLQAGPDYQFDRPGISIRGTMPFGATQQQFRGGVYSVGA